MLNVSEIWVVLNIALNHSSEILKMSYSGHYYLTNSLNNPLKGDME